MSIAVPLYGFGTGGNNQVLINVVGGLTQPENPKYGTIWIRTSTPVNGWEVFPITPVWDSEEGHVYIQNVPATDGNIPNFTALDYWRKPYGAIWLRLSGAMQRVNGAWVRQDAWVWRDNWIHFSSPRNTPEFTYTGDYAIVDDSDKAISDFATWTGNWKIRFLTSGTLTFTNLNGAENGIDVFLVGGGGGSWYGTWGGDGNPQFVPSAAAGGGYTTTKRNISVTIGTQYTISIGAGGLGGTGDTNDSGKNGGNTTAFGATASGGKTGTTKTLGGDGGSGGAGYSGGSGGVDGADGSGGRYDEWGGGKGQGTTTREFAETAGKLYSTGGSFNKSTEVSANTGDGGNHGSAQANGHTGASGIVIIRNARGAA